MDEIEYLEPVLLEIKKQDITEVWDLLPKDGQIFYILKGSEDPYTRDTLEESADLLGFEYIAVRLKK